MPRPPRRADRLAAIVLKLRDALSELETLRDEVQEGYDNMPESLQGSEIGEARETAASTLDEACSTIESTCDDLDGVEFR